MARRSLVLDAGAVIALSRGDRAVRALMTVARREGGAIVVPPIVVTQCVRGGPGDAAINQLLRTVWVPFVRKRLAIAAGRLLGATGSRDAADALIVAEAIRSGPSIILTGDPNDLTQLTANHPSVRIVPI